MRLKPEIKSFIKEKSTQFFPGAEIYLFGSRINNNEKGGDIDILILSDKLLEKQRIRSFRVEFFKKFGWQKIDLVNITKKEKSTFKKIVLNNCQPI